MNVLQIEIAIFAVAFIVLSIITYIFLKKKPEEKNTPKNVEKPKRETSVKAVDFNFNPSVRKIFLTSFKAYIALFPVLLVFTITITTVIFLTLLGLMSLFNKYLPCG